MEHYQGNGSEQQMAHQPGQNVQTQNSMPPQSYITSEQQQAYAQFVHPQQQAIFQQQQATLVRQNSLGGVVGGASNGQQPYQSNQLNALTQPIGKPLSMSPKL
ncbi:unnamed protein product [Toxocara canis]|nr:unnamed protein product [Toxocara canis]